MIMETNYIPSLIILSILVAILASYVSLSLAYNVSSTVGKVRRWWLFGGALAMGIGIWSMHFVGMLAVEMPGMEMAYDIPLMLFSIAVAVFGSWLALFVVSRPLVRVGSFVAGGVAMALAITGMHYIGMYSMRMAARIEWNTTFILLSIAIALVASYWALTILIRFREQQERIFILILASILMGTAIAGMHYTGMAAATFIADESVYIHDTNLVVTNGLMWAVCSAAVVILLGALGSSILQRVLLFNRRQSEEDLGNSEKKFRVMVDAVKDYAIFLLNPQGFITTWNVGGEKITGYTAAEVIGKHISTFYTEQDVLNHTAEFELVTAAEKGHFEGESIRLRKDGTKFWGNIVVNPLYNKNGRLAGFAKVLRDVTEIKAAEARSKSLNEELERRVAERTLALQASETQLRTISNAIPILVAQVDRSEKMLFANDSFCDWFECNPSQISNYSFADLIGVVKYPANKIYIDRVLAGETVTYQRDSRSKGRQTILDITFVPELDAERTVKGFIIVAMDVKKYKEIETELKTAKEAAEVANETKSAFLANMSHEIRTPLGAIIGFSELILSDEVSQSEKINHIEVIKRNGKQLSTIINDILDLSKVEAGKLEFEKSNVHVRDLLDELGVLLNLEAAGKGIQLVISAEGPIPDTIKTDSTRLRQILFNIIGNAIKFTEKGQVDVVLKLWPPDQTKMAFYIKDTGTGITPEQATRLFSPFTQADVKTTRKFGGTGLGLVLSKKLAKALGGDAILFESTLGRGSVFLVTIAHGLSQTTVFEGTERHQWLPTKPFENTPTSFKSQELGHLNILVVDDSLDNQLFITKILTLAGAQVDTANNGRQGVEKAVAGNYDVILMDLQMPEMDGFEATKQLRLQNYQRPIIALTAHAMKEERKRCLDSGFDEHITKPVDRKFLIKTLAEL